MYIICLIVFGSPRRAGGFDLELAGIAIAEVLEKQVGIQQSTWLLQFVEYLLQLMCLQVLVCRLIAYRFAKLAAP